MTLARGFRRVVAAKSDLSGTSNGTPKNLACFLWELNHWYEAPIQLIADNKQKGMRYCKCA